jgi:hypothetical protein
LCATDRPPILPSADIIQRKEKPMSPTTRYAFIVLTVLYGIYQLMNDRPVLGVIGLVFAALILWIGRRR